MEYVTSLKASLDTYIADTFGQLLTLYEKEKISSCLSGLGSVNIRLKSVSEFGFSQLRSSAVKPRIKPWLDTFFHSVRLINFGHVCCGRRRKGILIYPFFQRSSYELSEDDFSDDSVPMQTLIADLDAFCLSFKSCLSPTSYEAFVAMVTSEIALHMEKVLLKVKFNRVSVKMILI